MAGDQTKETQRGMTFALLGLLAAPLLLGIPFVVQDTIVWTQMNPLLLTGTVAFALALLLHASVSFSIASALFFFSVSAGAGLMAELAALRWGLLYSGDYTYNSDLRPQFMGLPLFIPLAWFVLAYIPVVLLRQFRVAGKNAPLRWLTKTLLCSLYLTAVDFSLDPLAISIGAWTWSEPGRFLGVPIGNFVGWFLVGNFVYGLYFAVEPDRTEVPVPILDAVLVNLSIALGLLTLLAVWVHVGHWLPMFLSVIVMAPFFIYWFRTHAQKI